MIILILSAALALSVRWTVPAAQAQTRPRPSAWPRANRATPTPTPTPVVTTSTLHITTSTLQRAAKPAKATRAKTNTQPPASKPSTEMVPFSTLRKPAAKPMFIGTPKDVKAPNLDSRDPYGNGNAPRPPAGAMAPAPYPPPAFTPPVYLNDESYGHFKENTFQRVDANPLSTFSIDVDTASYAIVRSMLNEGRLPPADAVRIEEMVNYFSYNYPPPRGGAPFAVNLELAQCPWAPTHKLARIGLKGRELDATRRPDGHFVFLIDVSGSMAEPNKLPLVKRAMHLLLDKLGPRDCVSIAVYAGDSGIALEPTRCDATGRRYIRQAIDSLNAGGMTQGSAGIQLAYELASRHFIREGVNRVILCTDGDFNVGVTSQGELAELIKRKAKSGIFLTILGFGMGNLKDSTMEMLADKGNGNYGYIDSMAEARKVLGRSLSGTLVTIAKDVKIQVEFNPLEVGAYRLIGYENRKLKKEDFNNDRKDAGEIGAGHTVTALYEIVPPHEMIGGRGSVDPLKYQVPVRPSGEAVRGELLTVKLRYKAPEGKESRLISVVLRNGNTSFERASQDFRYAAAVASFGMILRNSPDRGETSLDHVIDAALDAQGFDPFGEREEFVSLARQAKELMRLGREIRPW